MPIMLKWQKENFPVVFYYHPMTNTLLIKENVKCVLHKFSTFVFFCNKTTSYIYTFIFPTK